jgi:hypothetical protein
VPLVQTRSRRDFSAGALELCVGVARRRSQADSGVYCAAGMRVGGGKKKAIRVARSELEVRGENGK